MKLFFGISILVVVTVFLALGTIENSGNVVVNHKIVRVEGASPQNSERGSANLIFSSSDNDSMALENSQLRDENASLKAELEAMKKKLMKEERRREQASVSTERFTFDRDGEAVFLFDNEGNELFYLDLKNNTFSLKDGVMLSKEGKIFFNKSEIAGDNISDNSREKTKVRFENTRDEEINVFWIDYKGNPKHYKTLRPGETLSQNTYVSHPWVFTDNNGNPVQNYNPKASDELTVVPIE